jgi:hypothetical protein
MLLSRAAMRLEFFSITYGSARSGDLAGTTPTDPGIPAMPYWTQISVVGRGKTATTLVHYSPSHGDVISLANSKRLQKV